MERVLLHAEVREDTGSAIAKKLRAQGVIPGVVYARDEATVHISTNYREFIKLLHKNGENVVIDLKLKENNKALSKTVIIKEIQYNTLKEGILHIDFQQIKLTEKIRVDIPLVTIGDADAPGIKEGGLLEHILREIEIECLPTQIPKEIVIDVSALNVGDSIHVKDLNVPQEAAVITDLEQIAVLLKREAEEKLEEEKPEEEVATEPEVIREKKPEETQAEEKE